MGEGKMIKKLISVMCIVTLMVSSIGTYESNLVKVDAKELESEMQNESDVEILYSGTSGNVEWSINGDGCLRITGSGYISNAKWRDYAEYITTAVVEVTDISMAHDMFKGLFNVKTIDLSGSDFSDVVSSSHMFEGCTSLETVDFGDWNMSNVTDTTNMFYECSSLKDFDVSSLDMSKVRFMDCMFAYCTSLTDMDMSSWDVRSVETAGAVFMGCTNLKKLDLSNWDAQYVIGIGYMFADCTNLEELILEGWEVPLAVDDTDILRNCNSLSEDFVYPKFDGASGVSGDLSWTIDAEGCLTISGSGDYELEYLEIDNRFDLYIYMPEWSMYWGSIFSAKVEVTNITSTEKMFLCCPYLESVEFVDFDASKITNMSSMFELCANLSEVDMSGWDVSNVTDISRMFYSCRNLEEIKMDDTYFSTNVKDDDVFKGCDSLDDGVSVPKKAKILYQGTSGNVEWSINGDGCLRITGSGYISNAKWRDYAEYITTAVVEVTDISMAHDMFKGLFNVKTIDLSGSDFSDVVSSSHMFEGCTSLETVDFGDWNMSNVTDTTNMFYECSSLKDFDVSNWDMSDVRFMDCMFAYCTSLTDMDMSSWDVRSVETAGAVFMGCTNLKKLDLSNWDAQYVIGIGYMFADCTNLEELILEGWEVPLAVDDTDILRNCDSLSEDFVYPKFDGASGVSGDLSWTIDAEGCLTISGSGDYELEYLELDNRSDVYIDMPEWSMYWGSIFSAKVEVTNITSTEKMFICCPYLESVEFVDFDTSKVASMNHMFEYCRSLTKLDMSGWDISNVTSAENMFYMCDALKEISAPINANVTIKLQEGTWYDENRNVCTEIPQNTEHSLKLVEKSKLVEIAEDFKLEINGFQIRNDATGIRTLYSVNDSDNQVVSVGLIYGLSDYCLSQDMIVNSSNKYVYNFEATENGKMSSTVGEDANVAKYVMTMMFGNVADEFYSAPSKVRAYALLEDGTYVYSDIVEYSVLDVADYLYQNCLSHNEAAHLSLLQIISKVDAEYDNVEYKSNSQIAIS